MIKELRYSNTNSYLIGNDNGYILFDTGWAGTFPLFCKEIKRSRTDIHVIKYLFISHFHPDHMGIAQDLADTGIKIVVMDIQKKYIHSADSILKKERGFIPIDDDNVIILSIGESRNFLSEIGIEGEIIHTPGHSDDSISLWLDEGFLFVGDLNPLYELEAHKDTLIGETWEKLLERNPVKVYYGHAKATELKKKNLFTQKWADKEIFSLVKKTMKYIDRGYTVELIGRKTGADTVFIQDVARMHLTHTNISVQGILDRIEIKGK